MMDKIITSDEAKVQDYSRYGDINDYIGSLKGDAFKAYRKRWAQASTMQKDIDFPLFLVFETMFRCNLKCIMCIHSAPGKTKYGYDGVLGLDKFKEIIAEGSKYSCPSLTVGGTSEPLLDTRIADMIDIADKSGFVDTMINTNATLLTEETSRNLIETGLTRLRIGFDGATAKTYESIRIGARYEKVKENIINFIKLRDKMKSQFPIVRVSCVHLSANDSELKEFVGFWKTVADYVSIQRYKPHEFTQERSWEKMGAGKSSIENIKCSQPFERVYIRGNGDVHACCSMVYGPKIGNVSKSSIYEMWNSHKMKDLRSTLKQGDLDKIPGCKKCMINSYGLT
ncbi:radical SAM/SPASM domain-containing protein [Planctomycetota bacterium]